MTNLPATAADEGIPVALVCQHHWLLTAPDGTAHMPLSTGTCKHCGISRDYWTAGPPDLNKARAYAAPGSEPPTMARYM